MRKVCALLLFASLLLVGAVAEDLEDGDLTIDLCEPTYSDGVLTTTKGGVIIGPGLRIQAQEIVIGKCGEGHSIFARGDLSITTQGMTLVGSTIHYDTNTEIGRVSYAKGSFAPWHFGAKQVWLFPSGTVQIDDGYITTSPKWEADWKIVIHRALLTRARRLFANNITIRVRNIPIFWLPKINTELDCLLDHPVRYRFLWGGEQGPRLGMSYKILDYGNLSALFRFDYRFSRGPGTALETTYYNPKYRECFQTRSYIARDSSVCQDQAGERNLRTRYRLQGTYCRSLFSGGARMRASYDKLSDIDMAKDYEDADLELKTGCRTAITVDSVTPYTTQNLTTRVRVNSFRTVDQTLPMLFFRLYPYSLGNTGLLADSLVRFGYHRYTYAKDLVNVSDYDSMRGEVRGYLSRPTDFFFLRLTPRIGGVSIYYSKLRDQTERDGWLSLLDLQLHAFTSLSRCYSCYRHVVEPYTIYRHLTTPTLSADENPIFDLDDGWAKIHSMRTGVRSLLYGRDCLGCRPILSIDAYAYFFFDTPPIMDNLPRLYTELIWNPTRFLRNTVEVVYNREKRRLDQLNVRGEWTFSDDLALSVEYRHRGPFYWRKLDYNNFILDAIRSESTLLATSLSDKRRTILGHAHWRLSHDLAFGGMLRYGWDRVTGSSNGGVAQRPYLEYQIDLYKSFHATWHFRLSYQHFENDKRFAAYLKMGLTQPKETGPCCPSWW